MNDRPTATELIAAARQYLESDLIPVLTDPRLRFQTLIAANVLAIVERELSMEEALLIDDWDGLQRLCKPATPRPESLRELKQAVHNANVHLCDQIRDGAYDEPDAFRGLIQVLRPAVERKLTVANPRYLASFKESARG